MGGFSWCFDDTANRLHGFLHWGAPDTCGHLWNVRLAAASCGGRNLPAVTDPAFDPGVNLGLIPADAVLANRDAAREGILIFG
jgi:hypothetical protein